MRTSKFAPTIELIKSETMALIKQKNLGDGPAYLMTTNSADDWSAAVVMRQDGALLTCVEGMSTLRHIDELNEGKFPEDKVRQVLGHLLAGGMVFAAKVCEDAEVLEDAKMVLPDNMVLLMQEVENKAQDELSFDEFFDMAQSLPRQVRVVLPVSDREVFFTDRSKDTKAMMILPHDILRAQPNNEGGAWKWDTTVVFPKGTQVEVVPAIMGNFYAKVGDNEVLTLLGGVDINKEEFKIKTQTHATPKPAA